MEGSMKAKGPTPYRKGSHQKAVKRQPLSWFRARLTTWSKKALTVTNMSTKERKRITSTMTTKQRNRLNDYRIATWNVLSLNRTGAFKCLKDQLKKYKVMIAALQEIRWKESSIMDSGDYTLFCSSNGTSNFGTGFVVHKKIKPAVLNFNPINGRLCSLRIKMKFFNLSVICAHAPTEESSEEDKDVFYEQLERTLDSIASHDAKMIIGDMNAKLGREIFYQPYLGKHSLHEDCNNNGLRLVDFAISKNFSISSTQFPHKNIHKGTWQSPDGLTINQIDHVLMERRHGSDIMDVKSCRGADVDSDHFMVLVKNRQKISTKKSEKPQKVLRLNSSL